MNEINFGPTESLRRKQKDYTTNERTDQNENRAHTCTHVCIIEWNTKTQKRGRVRVWVYEGCCENWTAASQVRIFSVCNWFGYEEWVLFADGMNLRNLAIIFCDCVNLSTMENMRRWKRRFLFCECSNTRLFYLKMSSMFDFNWNELR